MNMYMDKEGSNGGLWEIQTFNLYNAPPATQTEKNHVNQTTNDDWTFFENMEILQVTSTATPLLRCHQTEL